MRPITPQQNTKMRLRMRLLAAVLAVGCLGGLTVRLFVLMLRDPGGYAARAADQQLRVLKGASRKASRSARARSWSALSPKPRAKRHRMWRTKSIPKAT